MTILNYTIPGISCGHCKMTIEREVGEIPGVTSVGVVVETKQAVIDCESQVTEEQIESRLVEIGFEPKK